MISSSVHVRCTGLSRNTWKIRLAEEILNMHIKQGDIMVADLDKENSKIHFHHPGAQKEKSEA